MLPVEVQEGVRQQTKTPQYSQEVTALMGLLDD